MCILQRNFKVFKVCSAKVCVNKIGDKQTMVRDRNPSSLMSKMAQIWRISIRYSRIRTIDENPTHHFPGD